MQNKDTDKQDAEILALLKDYPAPQAPAGFYDQALVRATHEGSRRQRNRWLMTGFGGAVAAGLVLWMVSGFFLTAPDLPVADPAIPSITMTLVICRLLTLPFQALR
jgi:hypothetical protein